MICLHGRIRLRRNRLEDIRRVVAVVDGNLWQPLAIVIAYVDVGLHRQADLQRMLRELLRIERNTHGHSLHDLDPVAGGILGRQQREGRAGARTESDHVPVEHDVAAVEIGRSATPTARPAWIRVATP